jgi:hypothetical protein
LHSHSCDQTSFELIGIILNDFLLYNIWLKMLELVYTIMAQLLGSFTSKKPRMNAMHHICYLNIFFIFKTYNTELAIYALEQVHCWGTYFRARIGQFENFTHLNF